MGLCFFTLPRSKPGIRSSCITHHQIAKLQDSSTLQSQSHSFGTAEILLRLTFKTQFMQYYLGSHLLARVRLSQQTENVLRHSEGPNRQTRASAEDIGLPCRGNCFSGSHSLQNPLPSGQARGMKKGLAGSVVHRDPLCPWDPTQGKPGHLMVPGLDSKASTASEMASPRVALHFRHCHRQ